MTDRKFDSGRADGRGLGAGGYNLIHGSDSPEAATRELELFFGKGEVLDFPRAGDAWVYDMSGGKAE